MAMGKTEQGQTIFSLVMEIFYKSPPFKWYALSSSSNWTILSNRKCRCSSIGTVYKVQSFTYHTMEKTLRLNEYIDVHIEISLQQVGEGT